MVLELPVVRLPVVTDRRHDLKQGRFIKCPVWLGAHSIVSSPIETIEKMLWRVDIQWSSSKPVRTKGLLSSKATLHFPLAHLRLKGRHGCMKVQTCMQQCSSAVVLVEAT